MRKCQRLVQLPAIVVLGCVLGAADAEKTGPKPPPELAEFFQPPKKYQGRPR